MDGRLRCRKQRKNKPLEQKLGLIKKYLPDLNNDEGFMLFAMRFLNIVLLPLISFSKESLRFFNRCTKPNRKEFLRAVLATFIGFIIMGFIAFFVKLLHIPITSILVE